jgi:hypothetical protein
MPRKAGHAVYLEIGSKRVFAGAVDWPGWCRSGRDEAAALESLAAYGPRYRTALGGTGRGFDSGLPLQVKERLKGDATTDFGAPSASPRADHRRLDPAAAKRHTGLLRASWRAFDRIAGAAARSGVKLRLGPRGGGRSLVAIVSHVLEADRAYLSKLGGRPRPDPGADLEEEMAEVRRSITGLVASRARGEPPPRTPRSGSLWTPGYTVRRSAWHSLDHAWEIEDRVI